MGTLTQSEAMVIPLDERDVEQDPAKAAHIVRTEKGGPTATALIVEARVNGTPVTALCGHTWVPSKDPTSMPICGKCKDIYELERMMNENLNDTPGV